MEEGRREQGEARCRMTNTNKYQPQAPSPHEGELVLFLSLVLFCFFAVIEFRLQAPWEMVCSGNITAEIWTSAEISGHFVHDQSSIHIITVVAAPL